MNDFTKDEQLIAEAILEGRKVQEYLWQGLSNLRTREFNVEEWVSVFQKRVDKIREVKLDAPHATVELRKRVLQQAALSILALKVLDA